MRISFFKTPKPRQYSFHTRYFDEKKLSTDDNATVEKGSFSKYKNKYRSNPFEKEFAIKERNRKLLILSIFLGLFVIYLLLRGFILYSLVPGVLTSFLILKILKKPSEK